MCPSSHLVPNPEAAGTGLAVKVCDKRLHCHPGKLQAKTLETPPLLTVLPAPHLPPPSTFAQAGPWPALPSC